MMMKTTTTTREKMTTREKRTEMGAAANVHVHPIIHGKKNWTTCQHGRPPNIPICGR